MQHGGHTQSTVTKGLEEKLDDKNSGSAGFSGTKKRDLLLLRDKLASLNPQLLYCPVQRRAGNSEFRCSTFWACLRIAKWSLLIPDEVACSKTEKTDGDGQNGELASVNVCRGILLKSPA